MTTKLSVGALAVLATIAILPASPAAARSSIRVGLADQSPRMFDSPDFKKLGIRHTRYFVRSDVNRSRSSGTRKIIATARRYNHATKFWFTETGALASFQGSFRYSPSRQAKRLRNMFSLASRFKSRGVQRVYSYNWFGASAGGCGSTCLFDSGLVNPDGTSRPALAVFAAKIKNYSR